MPPKLSTGASSFGLIRCETSLNEGFTSGVAGGTPEGFMEAEDDDNKRSPKSVQETETSAQQAD